ncbi:YolD-like family protein [Bacillus shivajii]|uniref:YolD-like family protein n=1 Tax=Bacillus shivajii TaxID=1983719 RepID=UPI001CFB9574|nr:YolD-like family protein [Bacillus shivajii]UCZ54659.1 YolD-like family protein [Bacillus shivajii]
MNRDRGVIKWTSMMLPEHVKRLKELTEQQEKKEKPALDEQVFEEWSRVLGKAYYENHSIKLTLFGDGDEIFIEGEVLRIDQTANKLVLQTREGKERVSFSDIIDLSVIA